MEIVAQSAGPEAAWTWAPAVLFALPAYAVVYIMRWRHVRRTSHRGAGGWRLVAFLAGLLALFVALVSPVDRLGEQMFFWHMAQHILLLDIAPILLITGLSKVILRPITAALLRVERALGPLDHWAAAMVLYVGTLWTWHIPALYELALRDSAVHVFQHLTLLSVGALFWWHVLGPIRPRRAATGLAVLAFASATKVLTGLLASAITFSPFGSVFYDFYSAQPRMWGLSAAEDQQLAGGLMMFEELFVMFSAVTFMFVRMLGEADRAEERLERYGSGDASGESSTSSSA